MPKLYETQSLQRQLELAVRTKGPEHVARLFAGHVGQFYDRVRFDALAREVRGLYAAHRPADGDAFRERLDRDLHGRYREPVDWRPGALLEAA
jgi:hypothetical protein